MSYIPNKYKKQASQYHGMIAGVNSSLRSALDEVNNVSNILSVGRNNNDLLTFNVIASNEKIKNEITTIKSELSSYSALLSSKAKELDDEEKRNYERLLASQNNTVNPDIFNVDSILN